MKYYILTFFIAFTFLSQAQTEKERTLEAQGNFILATYYYENGAIQQQGFFNKAGALEGLWSSYDFEGDKLSQGYYSNGAKTGQWLFWADGSLKEVDFVNSKIVNVSEWQQKSDIAFNMK